MLLPDKLKLDKAWKNAIENNKRIYCFKMIFSEPPCTRRLSKIEEHLSEGTFREEIIAKDIIRN